MIPIILVFYFLFIKEFNRVGFVNRQMILLIAIYLLSNVISFGWNSYIVYLSGLLLYVELKIYIPHRAKVFGLLARIKLNQSTQIYSNHIEQSTKTLEYGYEISQSEMNWLTKQVLLRSSELKQSELVYTDNEIIGNNYHVNIT